MPFSTPDLTPAEIAARLAEAQRAPAGEPYTESALMAALRPETPRPAAVLIPFLRQENEWHVLFTRRHAGLAEHSGQVAFPGGRAEPDDPDPETTALREAKEEIGLRPEDVQVLGRLNDFVTITNYRVTPVVGVMPWPYPLVLNPEEVSRVFTIPLRWLADPAHRKERPRALPAPLAKVNVIYFDLYDGELLWGVSARFTVALLEVLKLTPK